MSRKLADGVQQRLDPMRAIYPLDNVRFNDYMRAMPSRLARELKQTRPFASLAVEANLSVQRTADLLHRQFAERLRPSGLSPAQYNVLRILRGHRRTHGDGAGLPCSAIGGRLLTWDPDVTRLLDRLCARGLAARDRSPEDRRLVLVRITDAGMTLLAELDPVVAAADRLGFDSLSDDALRQLIATLDAIRERLDPESAPTPKDPS